MNIFAIADLHLSGAPPKKPMDVFGNHWQGHWQKIKADWLMQVTDSDIVLLAGDTSWGMRWDEALVDLTELIALPGRKVLIRGNHDYWWQTVSKMTKAVECKLSFLQNTYIAAGQWAICGSRGWSCPGDTDFGQEDQAIYLREVNRLRLSLEAAKSAGYQQIIVMLHYPPTDSTFKPTGFTDLLQEFPVKICVYGHLHGDAGKNGPSGLLHGTVIKLVACDAINFRLQYLGTGKGRNCLIDGE